MQVVLIVRDGTTLRIADIKKYDVSATETVARVVGYGKSLARYLHDGEHTVEVYENDLITPAHPVVRVRVSRKTNYKKTVEVIK